MSSGSCSAGVAVLKSVAGPLQGETSESCRRPWVDLGGSLAGWSNVDRPLATLSTAVAQLVTRPIRVDESSRSMSSLVDCESREMPAGTVEIVVGATCGANEHTARRTSSKDPSVRVHGIGPQARDQISRFSTRTCIEWQTSDS